ncbi:CheR family methyltransferase [Sulfurimonas sp. HSL3-7]|uniref:CheR family methyltransferase n=1 Tax=Sulfonitrofixus jiaomeiensis TaxID=3131938 RepID=UPI0031F8CBDC
MKDWECVSFLQRIMPTLRLQWHGFRKVRKQVCKRIERRIKALGLSDFDAYGEYLDYAQNEWDLLDGMCRITISRFYRDRGIYGHLKETVLPELAEKACEKEAKSLRIWSAGCASGEEPYTLSILWQMELAAKFPVLKVVIIATDSHLAMLARAGKACYRYSSLKELPKPLLERAFYVENGSYCLKKEYQKTVTFSHQDIRDEMPEETFDLILCRNLIFSYFDDALQRTLLKQIEARLKPGGYLLIGTHESLPEGAAGFEPLSRWPGLYRSIDKTYKRK